MLLFSKKTSDLWRVYRRWLTCWSRINCCEKRLKRTLSRVKTKTTTYSCWTRKTVTYEGSWTYWKRLWSQTGRSTINWCLQTFSRASIRVRSSSTVASKARRSRVSTLSTQSWSTCERRTVCSRNEWKLWRSRTSKSRRIWTTWATTNRRVLSSRTRSSRSKDSPSTSTRRRVRSCGSPMSQVCWRNPTTCHVLSPMRRWAGSLPHYSLLCRNGLRCICRALAVSLRATATSKCEWLLTARVLHRAWTSQAGVGSPWRRVRERLRSQS